MFLLVTYLVVSIVYASSSTDSNVQKYSLSQATVYQQNKPIAPVSFNLVDGVGNGYCVDLIKHYRDIPWTGNAKDYYQNAINHGFVTGNDPQVNAIFVNTKGDYGHVAMVINVEKDNFQVIEQNVLGRYIISKRIIQTTDNQLFIY